MAWALLLKLPASPNPHDGQLDAVACHRTLRAKPDSSLRNPGNSGDAVAGLKKVAVKRKVVQYQLALQRSKNMDASTWPGGKRSGVARPP